MARTVSILLAVLMLLFLVSCSGDGVVDDIFTVTVTYDGNGATSGEMTPQIIGRGIDARLEANAFGKTDYRFTGWNTASDGSGTAYNDCQSINTKEDITLYAQWELDEVEAIVLTSDSTSWTDGNIYTLNSDVTIDDRVTVTGAVTLILTDGYILTIEFGINVSEGNILTINCEGTGTLNIPDGGGGAGIGGGDQENCGNITINGGTVNATGNKGAGIGGGREGNGGTITINGGTVNATGEGGGAGIGGGIYGNGGNITINGGTINASGASGGAGIGKGTSGTDDGTLTLGDGIALKVSSDNSTWSDYNGTTRRRYMKAVTVTILTSSSSITYLEDGHTYSLNSDVTIDEFVIVSGNAVLFLPDGYTLTVTYGINVSEGNSLTINGEGSGTLVSSGPAGHAGIGGSVQGNSGSITINGGTINAAGKGGGAGIGGGREGSGVNITINGGTIYATGSGGAGIGGGNKGNSGTITINNGMIDATGSSGGAGIGGGNEGNCETITINGGTITATGESSGGAGIGGGYSGNGGNITINGGTVTANSSGDNGIGKGVGGTDIGTLTLGDGVSLKVSINNSTWSDYDGTTRRRYMKTVE